VGTPGPANVFGHQPPAAWGRPAAWPCWAASADVNCRRFVKADSGEWRRAAPEAAP
jgi:hypothetical protein